MAAADEETRAALGRMLAAQDAAWCAGDAEAFAADVADDVVFTNVVGMFSVGRAPFVAQHAHIFATLYRGSRLAQDLVHVTMIGEDAAIVDTLTTVTGFSHTPPGVDAVDGELRTRLEQVMVRRAGTWRVQSFHNVAVNPAAANVARPEV